MKAYVWNPATQTFEERPPNPADKREREAYENAGDRSREARGRREARAPRAEPAAETVSSVRVTMDKSLLRKVMMLCHPDRHGNSEMSSEVTRWLIGINKRLG